MNTQKKVMKYLFVLVPVLLILSIWWNPFTPFLVISLTFLMLLVFRNVMQSLIGSKRSDPPVYYQPPAQQQTPVPEPPPRTNPPADFSLTPQEFKILSQHYQQGYQGQSTQQPKTHQTVEPKYDHPADYDQPQAQYPQQMPPMF